MHKCTDYSSLLLKLIIIKWRPDIKVIDLGPVVQSILPSGLYRAFALIPRGPTQQKPWRPCWCSRQKSLIKIILNWNTSMAAVTSCANALCSRAANYCRTSDNVRLNLANVRAKVILIGHWSDHKKIVTLYIFLL